MRSECPQPPAPSSKPWAVDRCERIVHFHRHVGIDRYTGSPTKTYTVVTDREGGNLLTTYPGLP